MCEWENNRSRRRENIRMNKSLFFFCPTTVQLLSKAWIREASWRSCVNITQMRLFSPRGVTCECMNGCARDETSTPEADRRLSNIERPLFLPISLPQCLLPVTPVTGTQTSQVGGYKQRAKFAELRVCCLFFAYFAGFIKIKNLKTDQLWDLLYL